MAQTQNPHEIHSTASSMTQPSESERTEQLSRFFDGELEASRIGHVVRTTRQPGSEQSRQFDDYVLISDVLKGFTPRPGDAVLSERIAKALQQEPVYMGSARSAHSERFQKGRQVFRLGALAASVAAVGFVSVAMWKLVVPEQNLVASSGPSGNTQVSTVAGTVGPVVGASVVPVASWADPKTREMLDAHGSMAVRLRVAGER